MRFIIKDQTENVVCDFVDCPSPGGCSSNFSTGEDTQQVREDSLAAEVTHVPQTYNN